MRIKKKARYKIRNIREGIIQHMYSLTRFDYSWTTKKVTEEEVHAWEHRLAEAHHFRELLWISANGKGRVDGAYLHLLQGMYPDLLNYFVIEEEIDN